MNALQFYERVSKHKTDVRNMIGLTLLNIGEYSQALEYVENVSDCHPDNVVYKVNVEMLKWAYGI